MLRNLRALYPYRGLLLSLTQREWKARYRYPSWRIALFPVVVFVQPWVTLALVERPREEFAEIA